MGIDMSFGELSIQFFLLFSFLSNLTSTGNKFYLVETLNNAERTKNQDEPRENGHDYSETYEPEGERNYPEISAKDYAELTYAYGALGYDYSLGLMGGSTRGAKVPTVCKIYMQKLEQKYICNNSIIIKTPRTCEMCQKLMESSNAGNKKNHRDHQKTKYKKKKN